MAHALKCERYCYSALICKTEHICDPSVRNESHVGSVQVEKMANNSEFCLLSNVKALKPRIIILRPEMGFTPQY